MSHPARHVLQYSLQFCFAASLSASTLILISDNYLQLTQIQGSSMAPSLSPDFKETGRKDTVLWKKWRPAHELQRGDVVFFSLPHKPDDYGVKRVVALGGDTVLLDKRRRPDEVLDGRKNPAARNWDVWSGRVVVPEGHVWVEGDNWRWTYDSNDYGPISRRLIRGKALGLAWPWRQLGSKPWEAYKIKTKVLPGREPKTDWKQDDPVWWEAH